MATKAMVLKLALVLLSHYAQASSSSSRIVGGTIAGSYPFFVYLERPSFLIGCGGTLIWPDIVLSAAHCWDDTIHTIIARANFSSVKDKSFEHVRFVDRVAVHPLFNQSSTHNDIMLLKLRNPIYEIQPVGLSDAASIPKGSLLTVVGAGVEAYEAVNLPDRLQVANVPVVPFETCNIAFENTLDAETQLCAGEEDKDACQGDSGGPLLTRGSETQVGIVNFGSGCGTASHPGVYTKVSAFREWIEFVKCNLTSVPCDGSLPGPSTATSTGKRILLWFPLLLALASVLALHLCLA